MRFGVDLSKEFPKPLTTEVVEAADVVVTMGCGDACPVFPGKRYLGSVNSPRDGHGEWFVKPLAHDVGRAECRPATTGDRASFVPSPALRHEVAVDVLVQAAGVRTCVRTPGAAGAIECTALLHIR
jgi:hypothetical protein